MTGLDGVIARVGEIESRIVALDPATRAAAAAPTEAAEASAETSSAASTFAGLLEAATSATDDGSAVAGSSSDQDATRSGSATTQTPASNAELVSALQTLFTASSGPSAGSSSLAQYAGLIG